MPKPSEEVRQKASAIAKYYVRGSEADSLRSEIIELVSEALLLRDLGEASAQTPDTVNPNFRLKSD